MKMLLLPAVVLLLFAPGVCLGKNLKPVPDAPSTESLVTAVTVANDSQGTITISDDDTPFVVTAGTTIILDGHPATLADVRKGMLVMSRTANGSSAPEIDLKTVRS